MCLLVIAWKVHPLHDLVLAANRDERHDRATGALAHWHDLPGIIGGRDLVAGGTWLALHRDGRFAAVTNYHDETAPPGRMRSRGELVTSFLAGQRTPAEHAAWLAPQAADHAGFNLLIGDHDTLWYVSNRAPTFAQPLGPGVHGLSNHLLGTDWPKLSAGVTAMGAHVDRGERNPRALFAALSERQSTASDLPWPASSGPFIAHAQFGTRACTLLQREGRDFALIEEQRFGPDGVALGMTRLPVTLSAAA